MSKFISRPNTILASDWDGKVELADLQEAVGGLIEVICRDKSVFIVNEEGLILDLPFNQYASAVTGMHIVGNAVILTETEKEEFLND